jgi:hypothetical protein
MCGPGRATFTPDYNRGGHVPVFGAFIDLHLSWFTNRPSGAKIPGFSCKLTLVNLNKPVTGLAAKLCRPRRDSASFTQILEQVLQTYSAQKGILITDNLPPHISGETRAALLAWPEGHLLSLMKYACWLNLIESLWKHLRRLALKGRRFEYSDEIIEAIM